MAMNGYLATLDSKLTAVPGPSTRAAPRQVHEDSFDASREGSDRTSTEFDWKESKDGEFHLSFRHRSTRNRQRHEAQSSYRQRRHWSRSRSPPRSQGPSTRADPRQVHEDSFDASREGSDRMSTEFDCKESKDGEFHLSFSHRSTRNKQRHEAQRSYRHRRHWSRSRSPPRSRSPV